jgi:site-specific recombinase XerD
MLVLMMKCLAPAQDWRWVRQHPELPTKQEALASRRPIREVDLRHMFEGLLERLKPVVLETPGLEAALRLRDLLLVAMCTCTALRVSNLRSPSLESTIHRHGHGFELRYQSSFIKNRKQVTLSLMGDLTPYLDAYIARFRSMILQTKPVGAEDQQMLWLSRNGRRLDNQAVANIFKRVTVEVQGWAANPHSFRHSAATALLRLDLDLLDVASNLLAHQTRSTVGTHYDLSANQAAQRKWRELQSRYSK